MKYTVMMTGKDGTPCFMDFETQEEAFYFVEHMKEYGYDDAHILSL